MEVALQAGPTECMGSGGKDGSLWGQAWPISVWPTKAPGTHREIFLLICSFGPTRKGGHFLRLFKGVPIQESDPVQGPHPVSCPVPPALP